mmetsp:Transcript_33952/g.54046  ORF Transcript_33952/g.54046 Transcript_33952/m.54046 type:complete len:1088 (-) Transcript_33952:208-3471(-)
MASKSPLARFFKPVTSTSPQTPGSLKGDSPQTPAPQKGSAEDVRPQVTPPSIEARKREVTAAVVPEMPDAKKQRADEQSKPEVKVSAPPVTANVPEPLAPPSDLQATLQRARSGLTGSMPAFIAECFHYYNTGGDHYQWPQWMQPEHLRDSQGRRPTEPGYNPGTLQVPPSDKIPKDGGHGTPMLLQYWKLKSLNFDKIAFFKVGKFYELFYYDAFMAERTCGLKWMASDKRPHVGFPEMAKHDYAKKLLDAGYKVVVVEQVERDADRKERVNESKDAPQKEKGASCVQRDACEVFTAGTLVDPELLGTAGAKYMAYIHFEEGAGLLAFSVCLVDCATSQMKIGRVVDSSDRNALRTFFAQVQPSEVAYSVDNMPAEVLALLRRLPCRPQLSPRQTSGPLLLQAREALSIYKNDNPGKFDASIEAVLREDGPAIAAAGAFSCLKDALLSSRILPFATWGLLDTVCNSQEVNSRSADTGKRMILDATALSALEVLETLEGTYKGSLLHFLDHTTTGSGCRLLKQWVCSPLYDGDAIRGRQECVEFLIEHKDWAQQLSSGLKQIPIDLERVTARVWSYAMQSERNAVMYDDVTAKRLGEFSALLASYKQAIDLVTKSSSGGRQLPDRLSRIVQTSKYGGAIPDLDATISKLSSSVVEGTDPKNGKVKHHPQIGADPNYDAVMKKIDQVKRQLDNELNSIKKQNPKATFTFMHRQPGFRYEVECDEGSLPQTYMSTVDITQAKAKGGKVRFQTPRIKQLIHDLEALEDESGDCIFPFLAKLFRSFHSHQAEFRAVCRCLAELDALLSLAAASHKLVGSSCRANILVPAGPQSPAVLELQECRHPVAASIMGNSFVPNDTIMNANGVPGVLVVTGPNMGGKSTVLRQTCIAVIMAQLGCRVNAKTCTLCPVDRIFTRIGSYDTILEGKSTLLIELEETAAVMAHGSPRSLAVLDELGRGTSTFDGAAIASAVLDELSHRVGCLVLFATHYHPVSRAAAKSPKVAPYHMAANINGNNEMTFLYRFLPGLCPASYGHNVARLAGLPASVLEDALARSAEFERDDAVELERLAEAKDDAGLRELFRRLQPTATA